MTVRAGDAPSSIEALGGGMAGWRTTFRSVPVPLVQAVLIAALLCMLFQVWQRDLGVPLAFSSDTIWYLMQSKSTVDNGWWWFNPRLGAPFGLDELAYPSNSTLDQALVWVVSRFVPNAIAAVNLTWAVLIVVSGLTATWCLRLLGATTISAFVAGTLFALSPYALYRNVDHFALVIHLVPFACAAALWLANGQPHQAWGRTGRAVVFAGCALLGFNYVYYAFFGSFCIAAATLIGFISRRDRRLLLTGALCIGVIAGTTAINLTPSFYSWYRNGRPMILRDKVPAESEMFGLKIRQLVSPVYPNRFGPFHRWVERESAERFPNDNENWSSRLGLVGTVGFLGLLALLFVPDARTGTLPLLRGASRLTLAALLLATVGGFGTLFNLFVSPDIRAYNRISPFIAFFSLLAVVVVIDRVLTRQRARITAALLILLIGVSDQGQATRVLNERYSGIAAELSSVTALVVTLESALPTDAMVLQLPFRAYMGERDFGRMKQYDHFKPYLTSQHLRFSYPAFSNEQVRWQLAATRLDVRTLASWASAQGFSALLIDRYGYEDGGTAVVDALLRVVGETRVIARTDRFVAVNLTGLHSDVTVDARALEPVPLTLSLLPCGGPPLMQIDQIGATHGPFVDRTAEVRSSEDFKVSGWAVDHPKRAAAGGLDVVIDQMVIPSTYGIYRNDVADAYQRPSYRDTGFTATIPANAFAAGEHWLSVRVVASDGRCYYQSSGVRVTVN